MNTSIPSQLTLVERVLMLNQDQKRVFDNVKAQFLHQKIHEVNQCSCDFAPLRLVVSVVGGGGKAIKALVNSLWTSEGLLCAIAAPVGLAAFNVAGITIHRLFQLPVEHATTYWLLSRRLREQLSLMSSCNDR